MAKDSDGSRQGPLDRPLVVAEGLDVVVISEDEILIQFGARSRPSQLLRDDELGGYLGRVMRRLLDGPRTLTEILDGLNGPERAEVLSLVESLIEQGVIADQATSPVDQYLRYMHTGEASLSEQRVALIGAGPIGARIAEGLLQQGLGQLSLLDDRKANDLWHRLMPQAKKDTDAFGPVHIMLRERLLAKGYEGITTGSAAIDSPDLKQMIVAADLTIVAIEQPALRLTHLINRHCVNDEKPWLLVTVDGNVGLVGPLFVPPHTCCFNDYCTLADAATPNPYMSRRYRSNRLNGKPRSFFSGLPSHGEIVAGYGSLAATHFLLRQSCFALGRVISINFDRMVIDFEDVLKLPRCPVCGPQKNLYQPPFPADIVSLKA